MPVCDKRSNFKTYLLYSRQITYTKSRQYGTLVGEFKINYEDDTYLYIL
jgi:hypothetical protein